MFRQGVLWVIVSVVGLGTACTGNLDHPYDDGPSASAQDDPVTSDDAPGDDEEVCVSEAAPLTRLSKWEYQRTVEDLFPDTDLPDLDHPDSSTDHGFDNYAADLEPTSQHVEAYFENGRAIAEQVMMRPNDVLECRPEGDDFTACGRQFLEEWGTKIFRRPLTQEELDYYDRFYESPADGTNFVQATQLTLQLLLAAPEFIYRIDRPADDVAPGEAARVDAYSLASRMSYFLWGTMPDEQLFAAAADGTLDTAEGVRTEAERMLADPRALEMFLHFHENWLELEELEHVSKVDADNFDHDTREAMREETEYFLAEVIFRNDGSLDDLLTSRRTFVNGRLAQLYGVDAPEAEWGEVTLPEGNRAGIFTQPTFLASRAHPDKPSPVLRGVFILEEVMCVGLGSPPDDANQQADEAADTLEPPFTNREYYDATTMQGSCSNCHTQINGIGYSFEHYDTMGRWRDEDNDLPVDASGSIYDWEYDHAVGLMQELASSERVEQCVTQKWMRYARGSEVLVDNSCVADDVLEEFRESGGSLKELPLEIVTHPEFAQMRVPAEVSDSE